MATQTMSKDDILEAIGNMSVFELAELIEAFKSRFGVTIAAPAAASAGAAPAAAAPAAEEKTPMATVFIDLPAVLQPTPEPPREDETGKRGHGKRGDRKL